jgi:hypothetical protein
MNNMDKFCLKWNEFEANIRESFMTLREEERFFDVTLATDDGHQIQAHKMILSAGSHFFSDIFTKNNHSNMLIYLKGISSAYLQHVTDFLYNGEAFITQEELKVFIETAQELQVKGLQGDLQNLGESEHEKQESSYQHTNYNQKTRDSEMDFVDQESVLDSLEELADSFSTSDSTLATFDENKLPLPTKNEVKLQIDQMIEKIEGLWNCKVCGKTSPTNSDIRKHTARHIEGVSHACHICSKIFSTKDNLRVHISGIHSELVSCDICGKSGMNRKGLKNHKYKCH